MIIKEEFATKSDCYKSNKQIKPKGLMIHSVGCSQPDPNVFVSKWNKPGVTSCVHAVIGTDDIVHKVLPWTMKAWHCGGSANSTHIGVEMTEPSTIKYKGGSNWVETADGTNTEQHVRATYVNAVNLFAMLCTKFNLNPLEDGVILSHSEAHARGLGSGHADVEHIWSHYGLTMSKFRSDIKSKMSLSDSPISPVTPVSPTSPKVVVSGNAFKVKVNVDALNIRGSATTKSSVIDVIRDRGVYTIIEEKEGWGRLKSGKGWICLEHTVRMY